MLLPLLLAACAPASTSSPDDTGPEEEAEADEGTDEWEDILFPELSVEMGATGGLRGVALGCEGTAEGSLTNVGDGGGSVDTAVMLDGYGVPVGWDVDLESPHLDPGEATAFTVSFAPEEVGPSSVVVWFEASISVALVELNGRGTAPEARTDTHTVGAEDVGEAGEVVVPLSAAVLRYPDEVRVDGAEVGGWTYDYRSDAVVFEAAAAPAVGATIEVDYDVDACP